MNSRFTAGLSVEDRARLEKMLSEGNFLLDRLRKVCYDTSLRIEQVGVVDYDSPSWSHKQAHLNGKLEAYREIISLLEPKRDQRKL